jgi:hypothetical protein
VVGRRRDSEALVEGWQQEPKAELGLEKYGRWIGREWSYGETGEEESFGESDEEGSAGRTTQPFIEEGLSYVVPSGPEALSVQEVLAGLIVVWTRERRHTVRAGG